MHREISRGSDVEISRRFAARNHRLLCAAKRAVQQPLKQPLLLPFRFPLFHPQPFKLPDDAREFLVLPRHTLTRYRPFPTGKDCNGLYDTSLGRSNPVIN